MNLTGVHLQGLLARHGEPRPQVFCETGTFHGERAAMACEFFPRVYTVELSPTLHAMAAARWAGAPITFVLGDSRDAVRLWAQEFQEPVCWYLDAHWFDLNAHRTRAGAARAAASPVAGLQDPLPLWDELALIAGRPYHDLILVDDARDFGTERPVPVWRDVSLERIAGYFPDRREAAVVGDQAVIWR